MSMIEKISQYMDAGYPILYMNTFEELKGVKSIISASGARQVLSWSYAEGLVLYKNGEAQDLYKNDLAKTPIAIVLEQLLADSLYELEGKVIVFKDIHHYLEEPEVISLLKQLVNKINLGADFSIIFLSPIVKIPKELEKFITIIEAEYMGYDAIRKEIVDFIEYQELPKVADKLLDELAMAFKWLTKFEINNLLALAYANDGELTRADLGLIFEQKKQMIMKSGILEMVNVKESVDDIGGLENLKEWFAKKAKVIKNIHEAEKFGVDMPKGVLIAGVPGCGKSLNAKVASTLFEVPLLRMDMGRLMGKYVGESEGNMRRAIALSEAISPCVLWIDELEKAFAGINGHGGSEVTVRLFGNFLTWMQDKESPVFVVATANNIMDLPPELMRKGRFDEIYFVGLPKADERKKILQIHIKKRRPKDLAGIDLDKLVGKTEGYSGADLEGVVKDAVEDAFANGKQAVTTDDILRMIENTHSLSEIMKEPLEKMNKEYKERKFKNASK
ncbi:AAA family ATPase [Phascolarctobacterium succinatutens]|uniref:AAA family ATPase n=1 Tax=Phascolarctobacterium succinatutens TaxID=626940 RepID=UPI0026EEFA5A|nr:AAA family ATPase [Phascolarctobacterium succinatutens]